MHWLIFFNYRKTQGLSEQIFCGDIVYKSKRNVGKPNFRDQFNKISKSYKRVGYKMDIM